MKHKVFNLIILDESGSMEVIKTNIVRGFNEMVQTIKGIEIKFPDQEHYISFITFNGLGRKTLLWNEAIKDLNQINSEDYRPDASTPLFDAIGYSICRLNTELEENTNFNVLVTIFTDGEENASHEFNQHSIKRIIDDLKTKNWTFSYIGTDHNVEKAASSISINNSMYFEKTLTGLKNIFEKDKISRINFSQRIKNNKSTKDDYFKQ